MPFYPAFGEISVNDNVAKKRLLAFIKSNHYLTWNSSVQLSKAAYIANKLL